MIISLLLILTAMLIYGLVYSFGEKNKANERRNKIAKNSLGCVLVVILGIILISFTLHYLCKLLGLPSC